MKKCVFLLVWFVLTCAVLPCNAEDRVKITIDRVVDGDTIAAQKARIRIWGIDAPERGEEYALASTLFMETTVLGKELECVSKGMDRYKRFVMQCYQDGADIASLSVQMGMAKDYERYSKGFYAAEEKSARSKGYGMWKEEF